MLARMLSRLTGYSSTGTEQDGVQYYWDGEIRSYSTTGTEKCSVQHYWGGIHCTVLFQKKVYVLFFGGREQK